MVSCCSYDKGGMTGMCLRRVLTHASLNCIVLRTAASGITLEVICDDAAEPPTCAACPMHSSTPPDYTARRAEAPTHCCVDRPALLLAAEQL